MRKTLALVLVWCCSVPLLAQGPPLRQFGLGDGPNHVVFSPDGRFFLTSGYRGAYLWDPASGEPVRAYGGHTESVNASAFTPDGSRVITGSIDFTAKVWDASTRRVIYTFEHPNASGTGGSISSIDISPDGTFAITGSFDKTAKMWSLTDGTELGTFAGHGDIVLSVALSPNGDRLVTGSIDKTARIWEVATGTSIHTLSGHGESVNAVDFSPDGSWVLTGAGLPPEKDGVSTDNNARIWNAETGELVHTLTGHVRSVTSVMFAPDGLHAVTASLDGSVRIWNTLTGDQERTLLAGEQAVWSVAYSPDGLRIMTAGDDTVTRMWNVETGDEVGTYGGHSDYVLAMAISPDGTKLLSGGGSPSYTDVPTKGVVTLRDLQSGQELASFQGHGSTISSVAFSPDASRILSGSLDKTARIWDVETQATVQTFSGHTGEVSYAAYSPDGTRVLTGSWDDTAKLWNAETGELELTLAGHGGNVNFVAYAPDGTRVVTASSDGTARIWNSETGAELMSLPHEYFFLGIPVPNPVSTIAWSPDGTKILSGSGLANFGGYDATLWNAESGELIRTFTGHESPVLAVSFEQGGNRILTGSGYVAFGDNTARMWNADTGEQLRLFEGHVSSVNAVLFNPDKTRVLTGSDDGSILTWEIAPPRVIVVAGSGPYPGNPIAEQTVNLAGYAFRTLKGRGYTAEDILLCSAFGSDLDADGDGLSDVDRGASLAELEDAITGEFGQGASRLLVVMIGHGYRTGSFMAYRATPSELLSTTTFDGWLDTLQQSAPTDVTVLADFCYSGHYAVDAALDGTEGIPLERRNIIASTSTTAEAVFLPPPDLTSFIHTFLSSAYMGNSFGESFRAGERFFTSFPIASQRPQMDAPSLLAGNADREYFGASWIYGVQSSRDVNAIFPAFEDVSPSQTVAPGSAVNLYARVLPGQTPGGVVAVIRPPAPRVQSGEPVTDLPRVELMPNEADPELWEGVASPAIFAEEGPYTLSFTARFDSGRVSNPRFSGVVVSEGPDPDSTAIRAIVAVAEAEDAELRTTLQKLGSWAYSIVYSRYSDQTGEAIPGAVQWVSDLLLLNDGARISAPTPKGVSNGDLLAAIAAQDPETERLYIHVVTDDARGGELRMGPARQISAAQLDGVLDAFQARAISPEVVLVLDGPGSGSFYDPLLPTGAQRRLLITSGRSDDGAVFLEAPLLTSFTQRFLTAAWQGSNLFDSWTAGRNFFQGFLANYGDSGQIRPLLSDNAFARQQWLGRRWAFGADAELPFVRAVSPTLTSVPGVPVTIWMELLEGVDPVGVYAQAIPPGIDIPTDPVTTLEKIELIREGDSYRWSAPFASDLPGVYNLRLWAEYADGSTVRITAPAFTEVRNGVLDRDRWMIY